MQFKDNRQLKARLVLAVCLVAAIIIVYGYSSERSESVPSDTVPSERELPGSQQTMLQHRLQGTWESVGSQPGMRQIKLITEKHFTWVFYNRVTRQPVTVAGGTYTFTGDTYTERVEFGSKGVQQTLTGHDQVFTIRFAGDRMIKTGTLSNGMKINEVWKRVQ